VAVDVSPRTRAIACTEKQGCPFVLVVILRHSKSSYPSTIEKAVWGLEISRHLV